MGPSLVDGVPDCCWNNTVIGLIPLSSFLSGCCQRWACMSLSVGCWVQGAAQYETANLNHADDGLWWLWVGSGADGDRW